MPNTKKTARTTFKAFCPKCERGPFCITKAGHIRKHACWTKLSQSEIVIASERKAREEHDRECAKSCREIVARRKRIDRMDAFKLAFAVCSMMMIFLGSCVRRKNLFLPLRE